MTGILVLFSVAAFCYGCYMIVCEASGCPDIKTSRALLSAGEIHSANLNAIWDGFLQKVGRKLEPFISLDEFRRQKIQTMLSIADETLTPEEYIGRALAGGLSVALFAIPIGFVSTAMGGIVLVLAIAVGLYLYHAVFDTVKRRRKQIEREIPRFALSLAEHLKNDRDVLRILTSYRKVSGTELGSELDKTIAAMKSGNYETALLGLSSRVGSPMMTEVVRGLIGTIRGDDQTVYFEMLSRDMRKVEQNQLEKEAQKQPAKIRKYSMLMLLCIILIYAVVLMTELTGSLGAIF